MINNVKVFIVCLLLLLTSCVGKGGVKVQAEGMQAEHPQPVSELFDLQMIYSSDADRAIFDEYITHIGKLESYQESELITETARFFLNKPYVASTLEIEPEGLVVNLREFDCTTFVETVLALSRTVINYDQPLFDIFCRQLQNIRYRRGNVDSYTDRIHYFSDWIYENEIRGHVKDVTKETGGVPYQLKISYMSTHPDSYKQLKSNKEYVELIRKKESEISERDSYAIIPVAKISLCEEGMRNGDIVCFVTDIEGLDISHIGFVCHEKGVVTFIHASSSARKVIVNPQSLLTYTEKNKRTTGIMIVRPRFWD